MSHVIEIKGTVGFHLHLIVNWTTELYQARNLQGRQELIFPISSVILETDNKGDSFLVCNTDRYRVTNWQVDKIMKILSAQRSVILDTLRKDYFLPPGPMVAPRSDPTDLRDDWPHAMVVPG